MVLRLVASRTKLTRKLLPVGQPALGGLTVVESFVPSMRAARTCWVVVF